MTPSAALHYISPEICNSVGQRFLHIAVTAGPSFILVRNPTCRVVIAISLVSRTHSAYCKPDTHTGFVKTMMCPKPIEHMSIFTNTFAVYFSEWHSYNVFQWPYRLMKASTSPIDPLFPLPTQAGSVKTNVYWFCFWFLLSLLGFGGFVSLPGF